MKKIIETYNKWNRMMEMRRRKNIDNTLKKELKLGNWAIVIVFIVVVFLYDNSIQISKRSFKPWYALSPV